MGMDMQVKKLWSVYWSGNYTKNIRIKHRTQYTFSCWVNVLDANTTVYLEVIYNRAEIGQDRDGSPTGTYSFVINEPNKWQLVKRNTSGSGLDLVICVPSATASKKSPRPSCFNI